MISLYSICMVDDIIIRNTTKNDVTDIVKLQKETFSDLPEHSIWKEEHIISHLRLFSLGQFCAIHKGNIVGSCSSFLTKFSPDHKMHTWLEACGDFKFKNHYDGGDTLYDADISVHPKFQRFGIAKSMNELRKKLIRKLNLRRILSGSRVSNYHKYSTIMTVDKYIEKVVSKELTDPVLTFHLACGFNFVKILPNYLDDVNSLNNGVMMEWLNPNHVS